MSVETVAAPVEERTDNTDLIHLYCCRPSLALCGERLYGPKLDWNHPDGPDDCVVCVDLEDEPCGFPGCTAWTAIRSWWRERRSS